MIGLGNKNLSIIMGAPDFNECENFIGGNSSSSDDEGGDEAEKFKNTFLKNKNGSKFQLF